MKFGKSDFAGATRSSVWDSFDLGHELKVPKTDESHILEFIHFWHFKFMTQIGWMANSV